jgi:hypothetical protein
MPPTKEQRVQSPLKAAAGSNRPSPTTHRKRNTDARQLHRAEPPCVGGWRGVAGPFYLGRGTCRVRLCRHLALAFPRRHLAPSPM